MNIGDLVERNARLFGKRTAFVTEERKLTHAEFAGRAFAFGNALIDKGLAHQSRVAILMRNRMECLEAIFGCGSAGRHQHRRSDAGCRRSSSYSTGKA